MPIFVCGINHKSAPIELREKAVFATEKLALYLHDLITEERISDAVLLSTCNRSELYCLTDDTEKMIDWYCRQHAVSRAWLESSMVFYEDQAAIEHIMSVACGLDSMVLGESQILGQMKEAFSEAVAAGSVGTTFNRLFQQVFMVAKEIRTHTAIGACPVSVSSAAVNFVKQISKTHFSELTFLLIGAGSTIDLVLRHLKQTPPKKVFIANRSFDNALSLAQKYAAEPISLTALSKKLCNTDVLISATGGVTPILTKTMIGLRKKPLWMIDIAVPRDIETDVSTIENVFLYSIDNLKTIIQHNIQGREHAGEKAREIIKQKSAAFMHWLSSLDMVAMTIRAYRKQIEDLCLKELTKAKKQLQKGENPNEVLVAFAYAVTNKLLHAPSVQLRQAGLEGRLEILQFARELFAIPELNPEIL